MFDPAVSLKAEKASRYAAEPERVHLSSLEADFHGDNNDHHVRLTSDGWDCPGCDFFAHHGTCVHVMAMQRLLAGMLPATASYEFCTPAPARA